MAVLKRETSVQRILQICYRTPAGYTAKRKTGNGVMRKAEKEEYGLLCAVICCAQTPPPPPPPLSYPVRHFTCTWLWLTGLEAQGGAPPPIPTPLLGALRLQWQFSRTASNLEVVNMMTDIGQ
jgi:hypothetical protein